MGFLAIVLHVEGQIGEVVSIFGSEFFHGQVVLVGFKSLKTHFPFGDGETVESPQLLVELFEFLTMFGGSG